MENPTSVTNATSGNDDSRDRTSEFEELSRQLAEKELELSTLESRLALFEGKYAKTIGILLAELDEVEREIARELFRLNPQEEYRQGFQRAERKAKSSRETVDERISQGEKEPFTPSDELKNLFRKVAKLIHPDLATDPKERWFRTTLMARANEAYKKGDMAGLELILEEWERRDKPTGSIQPEPGPLDLLGLKLSQVKARIKEIGTKLYELRISELYQLMIKVEQAELEGRDLLGAMATNLQDQILAGKKLLASLQQKE